MARFVSAVLALAVLSLTVLADEQRNFPVSQQCLGCLCEAMSSCDITRGCIDAVCGPFSITWPYWTDGGKPTVNNESPESATAYSNCTRDTYCSTLAVQGYMDRHKRDCNGDGKIDCDDFAAIHKMGPDGCKSGPIRGTYAQRYQQCKVIVGALTPD